MHEAQQERNQAPTYSEEIQFGERHTFCILYTFPLILLLLSVPRVISLVSSPAKAFKQVSLNGYGHKKSHFLVSQSFKQMPRTLPITSYSKGTGLYSSSLPQEGA